MKTLNNLIYVKLIEHYITIDDMRYYKNWLYDNYWKYNVRDLEELNKEINYIWN